MEERLNQYIYWLKNEQKKPKASNTIIAYITDFKQYLEYLNKNNIDDLSITCNDINNFLEYRLLQGKKAVSNSRMLAVVKSYYAFLIEKQIVQKSPISDLKKEKCKRNFNGKKIDFLTFKEIDKLIKAPDTNTIKGKRDKAMFELIYATGIKVSELVNFPTMGINFDDGCIYITRKGRQKIIPVASKALDSIKDYLDNSRTMIIESDERAELFVNLNGKKLTRQGFWKIIKEYGKDLGLEERISPQILRNSCAIHLLENGADYHTVRFILGNETITPIIQYRKSIQQKTMKEYMKAHPRA